jgi:hypothetical protein
MPKSRRRKRRTTTLKLTPEAVETLKRQREAFRKQFGRDPGPNDPVFFDPDVSTPTSMSPVELEADTIRGLEQAGAPPQVIYASATISLACIDRGCRRLLEGGKQGAREPVRRGTSQGHDH